MKITRIAVADSDRLYRSALIGDICAIKSRKVLFCAGDGREAIDETQVNKPDILIINLFLPIITGIEVIRFLRKHKIANRILAISSLYQPEMLESLKSAGADGYCSKKMDKIEAAMDRLEDGHTYFPAEHYAEWEKESEQALLIRKQIKNVEVKPIEIKLIQLTCEGKSNQEIGDELALSKRTIDTYIRDLLQRLNLKSKIELVSYANSNGICRLSCHNSDAGYCACNSLFL